MLPAACRDTALGKHGKNLLCSFLSSCPFSSPSIMRKIPSHPGHMRSRNPSILKIPSRKLSPSASFNLAPRTALGKLARGCTRLACPSRRAVGTCPGMVVIVLRDLWQNMCPKTVYWYSPATFCRELLVDAVLSTRPSLLVAICRACSSTLLCI